MSSIRRDNKNQTNQDTFRAKYIIRNSCLYKYKDPDGNIVQINRPAFIKIQDEE